MLYNLFGYNSVDLKDIASNEEEEILDIYRKLSKENKSVILKNFYILLNPDERSDYQILKILAFKISHRKSGNSVEMSDLF